ncbi:helix-turn-helix transcriptional regulator [Streptomyces sp. R302]|uniref:helix-turn-helix transcriptional regulator n=1 Tax=unclassified Streptomyces TaxID=2593676 RepID=UPI00145F480C|nr:helix-turn-helix transcriptional regulator [Streptomyces sp. R301]NML80241.1 helix-turn-helix transcriptional regulator [Streptomyces sp. R302]
MENDGNVLLRAARIAAGYGTQEALADAVGVAVRQVRRWESANPPWPRDAVRRALTSLLGQNMEDLGFTPPDGIRAQRDGQPRELPRTRGMVTVPVPGVTLQPATAGEDFAEVTRRHRRLYWTVAPATLHPAIAAHTALGCALLPETAGIARRTVAAALAESFLLAGRIQFFDSQEPDTAKETWTRALQAASQADDQLLGAAILAHSAFIPGWAGDRQAAVERMTAARTYARRGEASAAFLAWLDAVEAECETRCGHTQTALSLLGHAEEVLTAGPDIPSPEWMDWFSPVRLAAFKGHTQLTAGHLPQARETLLGVLDGLEPSEDKQRTVIFGDLAAVEAADRNPEKACEYAVAALEQLRRTWYSTGMDRVRDVRRALAPWQHERCVRDLDDRLYGWETTVSALGR